MSYQEQAEKLNTLFKQKLQGVLGKQAEAEIIEAVLRFGQIAKFRCRNNTAYDSFSKLVFKDIAELKRSPVGGFVGVDFLLPRRGTVAAPPGNRASTARRPPRDDV